MILSIIAAHDPDLVIGYKGSLPWHIPEDLKHFKERTYGHTIVMGRGVFEELEEKPLPGRENIVLTSRTYDNVTTFDSIDKALNHLSKENKVYIIGGGQIYRQTIDIADRLEITQIHKSYSGDVYFPEYRDEIGIVWQEIARKERKEYSFVDYRRI